jgi:hypothetical protein
LAESERGTHGRKRRTRARQDRTGRPHIQKSGGEAIVVDGTGHHAPETGPVRVADRDFVSERATPHRGVGRGETCLSALADFGKEHLAKVA